MKVSDFHENEEKIAHETSVYSVALDGGPEPDGGLEPRFAAQVGVIISLFALVEGYVPMLLQKLTGLDARDAQSLASVPRSFTTRLELIEAVCKPRGAGSIDAIVATHFVQQFREANRIRNRYAHATYSTTRQTIVLSTFSSDFNREPEHLTLRLDQFKADGDKLRRIICELHALTYRNEISAELHKRLLPRSP